MILSFNGSPDSIAAVTIIYIDSLFDSIFAQENSRESGSCVEKLDEIGRLMPSWKIAIPSLESGLGALFSLVFFGTSPP